MSRSASSPVIGAISPSPIFSPRPLYLQKLKISSSPLHSPHLSPRLSTPSPIFSNSPSPVFFSSSPRNLKSSGMFKVVKSPAYYDLVRPCSILLSLPITSPIHIHLPSLLYPLSPLSYLFPSLSSLSLPSPLSPLLSILLPCISI